MDVELNVAYKPTERQQIILRIIKNEDTDNVALNGKPSVNPRIVRILLKFSHLCTSTCASLQHPMTV